MINYVDRFHAALTVLTGHGHIKQRLIKAYEEHLGDIDEEELPIAVKQTLIDLRQSMHRVTPLRGESAVCASVRKMSPDDAAECTKQVLELFGELARRRDGIPESIPINDAENPRVPPFLIKSI